MESEWRDMRLSAAVNLIGGGTPKRNVPEYWNGSIPWLSVKDFNNDCRHVGQTEETITELGLAKSSTKILEKGQLIISARGTVGALAQLSTPMAFNQSCYGIDAKPEYVTNDFLFYLIKYSIVNFRQITHGAVFDTITRETFDHISVKVPPLPEQRAIANILGSLDDKIELNRRMNQTLEGTARAIFKSWFVDFDPVRAKVDLPAASPAAQAGGRPTGLPDDIAAFFPDSFEDSELGEIPKGWEVLPLPEIIDVNPIRTLKKGQIAPYLEMKNMPENSARALDWYDRQFGSGMKFINGDTLMARITPCLENGKGAFVDFLEDGQVGWGSTEYIVFRAKKPLPLEYSYYLSRTNDLRAHAIVNMTGSSGRQRVPASIFDSYLVINPSEKVAECFGMISDPIMQKIKKNDEETCTLASLRDALLPKLISGELRVAEAEKFVEEDGL